MVRSRSRALLPCLALALFLCPVRARADQSFEPPPASEPPPTSEPPPALLPTAPPPANSIVQNDVETACATTLPRSR